MLEADLEAVVLRRVLALQRFPLFQGVELAELATLAQNVVETHLRPGDVVAMPGARIAAAHLVLEGCIASAPPAATTWHAHDVFGAIPIFAERPARLRSTAIAPTRTLRIDADDLAELLDDNHGILVASIRSVAERLAGSRPRPRAPLHGPLGPLGLVDRLFLLRREAPFARAGVRSLAALAQAAQEVTWEVGESVAAAERGGVLVEGELRGHAEVLRAGDSFGWIEMLAGKSHDGELVAASHTRALASTGASFLDVIDDHPDLGLHVLSAMSRELLAERR
jgi:CRP-like cAMP-binding protein